MQPALCSEQDPGAVRLVLIGSAGPITLHVSDREGPGESSLLSPDDMQLNLAPGPACNLAFDGPTTITSATRAVLPQLRVVTVDVAGNPTKTVDSPGEVLFCHCSVSHSSEALVTVKPTDPAADQVTVLYVAVRCGS